MACAEYEDRIIDWQEGALPAHERRAVEDHLAECLACRHFAEELNVLDAALARVLRPARLPVEVRAALMDRVDADAAVRRREDAAARKAEAESDLATFAAQLKRRVWRANFGRLLDGLGVAGLFVVAVLLGQTLLQRSAEATSVLPAPLATNPAQLVIWVSVTASLFAGVFFAFRQQARR
jgi:hypothetical protein